VTEGAGGGEVVEECEDEAVVSGSASAAPSQASPGHPQLFVDFYIVYSPVYRVPVLYFRGRTAGGAAIDLSTLQQTALFYGRSSITYPLNTLEAPPPRSSNAPDPAATRDGDKDEDDALAHFPAISQGEHPVTGLPCYFLHPCETSATLAEILGLGGGMAEPRQVVECWMMLVGTVIDVR